ncbi:MAG: NUDIX hydrolase [Deltaproteobacteria bacterium]|nr:NUDIX hydrolase [Deltaproteobacteria bacterium]
MNREESLRIRPTCPNCGYVHYRNPCPGVVVIIEQEDRILLGKRAAGSFQAGKWCLPGGFIEFDEDYVASAVREVKEETNLEIEVNSILNVNSNFLSRDFHTLVITVVADVKKGCPEPGDDIVELGWFHINGDFPDMAFSADEYIIRQFRKLRPKALSFVVD